MFARHGETEDNKSHTLAGHQPGKLTHTGKEQANKIGKYLKNHSFDHIYVSDLGRTKETFQNILKEADGLKNISTTYSALLR